MHDRSLSLDIGHGPAIRVAAFDREPDETALDRLAQACLRAVQRPD